MKIKQLRAVVHVVDQHTVHTEWFPMGSPEVLQELVKLLSPGKDALVVWEEREAEVKDIAAGCDPE